MTGAEATLLAGLVGGGSAVLAAGLATFGTYKVTSRSIDAQEDRAKEDRLADAYVDLVWMAHAVMAQVEATRPVTNIMSRYNWPGVTASEEARIMARVRAIGSTEVCARLQEWHSTLNSFRLGVGMLDSMGGGTDAPKPASMPNSEWGPVFKDMNDARSALRHCTWDLDRAIRTALTGEAQEPEHDPSGGA